MKDMIFWGVVTICNLILVYNEEESGNLINFITCSVPIICFIYSYLKEDKNEKK